MIQICDPYDSSSVIIMIKFKYVTHMIQTYDTAGIQVDGTVTVTVMIVFKLL
jgi:hypothetical protein